jgi:23S rRNA pseudouridine1911/1915/1917 synthase
MQNAKFKILYEDDNLLAIEKPAGMVVDDIPRRVHRLDKETSGILLIAKNDKALEFFQKQFKERKVKKKYLALIVGNLKQDRGVIETLIGRSPKNRQKQKVYLPFEPGATGKRKAITEYKVLKRFDGFTLIEATPKTGRKHQIRCHLSYLGHPIVGDKMYGFKNQILPKGLKRHFLHATYLKIKLPDGAPAKAGTREFKSDLPEDLKSVLEKLNEPR